MAKTNNQALFVKTGVFVAEFIVVLILFVTFSIFTLKPEATVFTNVVLLLITLIQLFTVNILLKVYEKL